MGVLVDVVAVSFLVLFALVLVVSVVLAATARPRTGERVRGSSPDASWGVFAGDGGNNCGGGDSGGGGGGGGGD